MGNDSHTTVTRQSWGGRIGNALAGVLIGIVMFIGAFPLIFWNEGRSIQTYKTLKEGSSIVITVPSNLVNPDNEGKLVHLTGKAVTPDILSDPIFPVSLNAIKLARKVEMYQWKEESSSTTEKKIGGGTETVTTYTYSKTWSDSVIDSGDFDNPYNHQNPGYIPYESNEWIANQVNLGSFLLNPSLVEKINDFSSFYAENTKNLPAEIKNQTQIQNGTYYIGENFLSPQIGDLRVSFEVVLPTDISMISRQLGNSFEPYHSKFGGEIELLETGTYSSETMFQNAVESNKILTWILRLAGFLMMFIGLSMVFKPLSVITDVLPILGNIVGAGTGLVAFLIAAFFSTMTIGISWLFFRPLLGIPLVCVSAGLAIVIKGKLGRKKEISNKMSKDSLLQNQ